MEIDILIFACEDSFFGVRAAIVQEVLNAVAVVPVPTAPPTVLGVMNLRGRVVPVLSARQLLGWENEPQPGAARIRHSDHFIVIREEGLWLALHVQRAVELTRVQTEGSDRAPAQSAPQCVDLHATTRHGLVQVIQPLHMLSNQDVEQLAAIAATASATEFTL